MLGAKEQALESLEQWAANSEEGQLFAGSQIFRSPAFDAIRNDLRFQAVMRLAGLSNTPLHPEPKQ